MTREEAKSCIGTIELLQRLAYNIHGVMDVIDAGNCKKIIEALKKEPRWIPVTERLPEEDGRYLCTYENEFGICVDFGKFYKGDWFVGRVTAWMPLPEPYKAESEDEE